MIRAVPMLSVLAVVAGSTGCVERILQVRSDPPGATVYLNGERIGETPLEHRFAFYGTVDVSLRAKGHWAHRKLETLSTPWYQAFPVDFFSEFLVPWKIRDVHEVEVTLTPAPKELPEAERQELGKKLEAERSSLSEAMKTPKA